MSVALDINPELMIMDKTGSNGSSYRLDSGKEDLNRVIASDKLETLNFVDISIEGFDSYLFFADIAAISRFIRSIKVEEDGFDVTPYTLAKDDVNSIAIVYGKASISLSGSNGKVVDLCRPVYRVNRDKKTNALIPIDELRAYIVDSWTEECKEALFHSGSDASQRFGIVKRLQDSEKLQLRLLKMVLGLATVIILIIAVGAIFRDGGAITTANARQSVNIAPQAAPQSNSLLDMNQSNSLMDVNHLPAQQQAQIQANNQHPANAVYGAGMTGAEGQATVEDFARLQVEQTQGMLKEMGVDVTAGKQNLGCFAEGNS